jgi:DNA adenine methylase
VNLSGQFNVPFGRYTNPTICDEANLRACSAALAGVELAVRDFAESLKLVRPGDVIYADSPYFPVSPTANFTAYTADGFGEQDQERLASEFRRLVDLGAYVVASNAAVPAVRKLYAGFRFVKTSRSGGVNCKATKRGAVPELIIVGERVATKAKRRHGQAVGVSGDAGGMR